MISVFLLFMSVLTLFCYMIPGFVLKKTKLVGNEFARGLSQYTLYIAQGGMLLHGFIAEFDPKVFRGILWVFLFSFISHSVFYLLAKQMFKKAPDSMRRVLQFGVIFSNAGYMGIPVINDVFGSEYAIYATVYVIWFNVFEFSLGRLIYTDDKKYISVKKIFLNPAVVPIAIGMVIYLTGVGGWMQAVMNQANVGGQIMNLLYNVITVIKNTVAPASMMVIGARLADISFKGIFKDKYMYPFVLVRLFLFPAIMWAIMRVIYAFGLIDTTVISIVLILCSTPAAAMTTMFAELYDGDAAYAGKLVALTTLLSILTMPITALLLKI